MFTFWILVMIPWVYTYVCIHNVYKLCTLIIMYISFFVYQLYLNKAKKKSVSRINMHGMAHLFKKIRGGNTKQWFWCKHKNSGSNSIYIPKPSIFKKFFVAINCTAQAFIISQILWMWEISFTHKNVLFLGINF